MDLVTLQHELQLLPGHQQDRLAAFLALLRMRRDGVDQEIQARLDDSATEHWHTWEQVKVDLGITHPGAE